MSIKLELIEAYKDMGNHTLQECKNCSIPLSCCKKDFCDLATKHAEEHWNICLETSQEYRNGETHLPYLSKSGCIVPNHLRPSCSIHCCCISLIDEKLGDKPWTKRYYKLLENIKRLELEKYYEQQLDYAWAAGVIDGEGCIYSTKVDRGSSYKLRLQVGMTDESTIDKLKEIFKVGNIHYGKCNSDKNLYYYCVYNNKNVVNILKLIYQYMTTKKNHAFIAMQFEECINKQKGWNESLEPEIVDKMRSIHDELRRLNKRGK